jgi:hypothetical protein
MNESRLPHPYCPSCSYNLTGLEPSDELYTCPECGRSVTKEDAHFIPWYIGPTKKLIHIATIPPALFFAIIVSSFFLPSGLDFHPIFFGFLGLALLWFVGVATFFAYRVSKWKGPNDWSGPSGTFTKIILGSIFYFIPIFFIWLVLLLLVQLGSAMP